ncbi:MAG: hypothetical protein K6A40_08900 [Solobacterium sp.]|nr:hypothetical protein [Solobacterium sp.]
MSKRYLNWLIRDRKMLLIFTAILYLAVSLISEGLFGDKSWVSVCSRATVMSVILLFVLPLTTFAFVHRKQSTDVFFSLPLSRRDQVNTGIVFCTGINFLLWLAANIGGMIFFRPDVIYFGRFLILAAHTLLWFLSVTVLNTVFFLFANNIFDGVVMVAAYSFLPVAVLMAVRSFSDSLIAGLTYRAAASINVTWLSAVASGYVNEGELFSFCMNEMENFRFSALYLFALIAGLILGCVALYYHFIRRKTERADMISDDFMAYPLIIHIYLILTMTAVASSFVFELSESIIAWLVLLAIYVTAMFVYKRRLSLNWKVIAVYVCSAAAVTGLCQAARITKGFGIPESLPLVDQEEEYTTINYEAYCTSPDLGKAWNGQYDSMVKGVCVHFRLIVRKSEQESCREALEVVRKLRMVSIAEYYTGENHYTSSGSLSMTPSGKVPLGDVYYPEKYQYRVITPMNEADLKTIAKYTNVYADLLEGESQVLLDTFLKRRGS